MKHKRVIIAIIMILLMLLPSFSNATTSSSFTSSKYKVINLGRKILTNIVKDTTVGNILKDITIPESYTKEGYNAKVYNYKGVEMTDNKIVGTGSMIRIVNKSNHSIDAITAIVYGDVTGDGKVNVADSLAIIKNKTGKKKITDINFIEAGRITPATRKNIGTPGVADALFIVKATLGKAKINPYYDIPIEITSYEGLYNCLKTANTNIRLTDNTPKDVKQAFENIKKIIEKYIKNDMSDTVKALVLHDYLVANSKLNYDVDYCKKSDNESNICNIGKTMNQLGFANAYTCLLGMAGIESKVVDDKYANTPEHIINAVYIDNQPYWVSCSADSYISQMEGKNKIRRYFFLRNNEQLKRIVWEGDISFNYTPSLTLDSTSRKYEGVRWVEYRKNLDYKENEIKYAGNKTVVKDINDIEKALKNKKEYIVDVIDPSTESVYELDEFCKKVIAKYIKPNMTEAEKALEIHDFICSNFVRLDHSSVVERTKYLKEHRDIINSEYDMAWGHFKTVLLSEIGDCWSATSAFNTLCMYAGIETQSVMSYEVKNPYALGGSHEWSFVKIDGQWYNCDCEGGDYWEYGKVDRMWFLNSDAEMHLGENKKQPCTSTKYDNYKWPEFKGLAYYQDKTGIINEDVKASFLWIQERKEGLIGRKYDLRAKVFPYGSNSKITYTSSNPKIAQVDKNGTINVLAVGTVKITAKVDGISKSFTMKCGEYPTKVEAEDMNLKVGESKNMVIKASPEGSIYHVKEFVSSNESVATVDKKTGVVTAVGEGTCNIAFLYYYQGANAKDGILQDTLYWGTKNITVKK